MDFSEFKKKKSQLLEAIKGMKDQKTDYKDPRFWEIKKDEAGNGVAIIRFLPQKDTEKLPFVKLFSHSIEIGGRWFIEPCPSTIGEPCPVCEYALPIFDTLKENESNPYYRKTQFVANILVVKEDPANPEREGKTWLYSFGKKLYEKIISKTAPESEIEEALNVFDLWEGYNFKLKVTKQGKWPSYDSSEFQSSATPVAKKEAQIEAIYNSIIDLDEFVNPKRFKSYDELLEKFNSFIKSRRVITSVESERKELFFEKSAGKSKSKDPEPEVEENNETETDGETDFDSLMEKDDKKQEPKKTADKKDKGKSKSKDPEPEVEENEDKEEFFDDSEGEKMPWEEE